MGAWFAYIPSRHKKRLLKFCKNKNKGLKKDHFKYINWWDLVEI